ARRSNSDMTQAGAVIGTPLYMAPEQVGGTPVSKATDIYAFGVVLFEMLTGASPYPDAKTRLELESAILRQPPSFTALNDKQVPPALQNLVAACLEKDPIERPESFSQI